MKKNIKKMLCFLLLFPVCTCFAAKLDRLTDDDAGQIVFRRQDAGVFVFRKNDGKVWHCEPFRGNGRTEIEPHNCVVTDLHEDTVTPDDVAFYLTYYTSVIGRNNFTAAAYKNMALRLNASATANILAFEAALEKDSTDIANEVRSFRQKQEEDSYDSYTVRPVGSLAKSLLVLVETSGAVARITDLFSKDQNIFAAYCHWERYCLSLRPYLRHFDASERRDLTKELSRTGDKILAAFQQMSSNQRKRCSDFKKVCPGKYGTWDYAPPRTLREMRKRVEGCFRAWEKMRSHSAFSEFPEWGSAALEVMQMIHSPRLEQQFDTALRNYQKILNN